MDVALIRFGSKRFIVLGEARNPGVYTLPPDARVLDAIEAAGGVVDPASTNNLNLAQPVVDG